MMSSARVGSLNPLLRQRTRGSRASSSRRGITKVALVGILAGLAIGLFAGVFTWIATSKGFTDSDRLDVALRQALKGDYATAAAIAESIDDKKLAEEDLAKKRLAQGLKLWEHSQEFLEHKKSLETFDQALVVLKEAKELGFPTGYEGLGNLALGLVQTHLNEGEDALPALRKASVRWPSGRSDAMAAILQILLERDPPAIEDVLAELEHWRSLPGLGPADHDVANLVEARALELQGQPQAAFDLACKIPQDSPHTLRAELAQVKLARAMANNAGSPEARRKWLERALESSRAINESPQTNSPIRRSSLYHTASLLRELERNDEALSMFSRIRLGHPETPEALTSGMEEIEILLELGRAEEAIGILAYLKTHVTDLRWYADGKHSFENIRGRLIKAGQSLIRDQLYDEAVQFAEQLPILCTDTDRIRLLAEAYRSHGEKIATDAGYFVDRFGATPLRLRGDTLTAAQGHFRKAGHAYDRLSSLELRSPDYSELLWQAIECYRTSHDLDDCNELLDRYMQYENRGKRPRALMVKGENLLAQQNREKALFVLNQLLEFYSDSPLVYRTRMLSSQALSEDLKFDEASEMLLTNLYDGSLSPESPLWRDSLIELGNILFRRGELLNLEAIRVMESKQGLDLEIERLTASHDHLRDSIRRFEEVLKRFSDDPRLYQLQYNVAQAYRLAAELPKRLLDDELAQVDSKRKQNVQKRRELLTGAIRNYVELRNRIQDTIDPTTIDVTRKNMLRNCYFAEADILFELGDYPAALNAYNAAATQYMNEPEVMEALLQKSRCHELMGNLREAKQVILQSQQILKRISDEKTSRFPEVTRYDRQQWEKHLEWLLKVQPVKK